MSLLCVTVRRARLIGTAGQFNCYVTLKLQNVKSTTVSVKGNNPTWEQDFIFETNRMDIGLIIEVWHKGMIWDKLVGTQWMPLTRIKYTNEVGEGQWLSLDTELVMEEGEIVGTKVPTGHSILLEAHFELPCDLQDIEEEELMRKLEILNRIMDQEITSLREQDRRHNFSLNSGVSEDSDYTSDVSYPTGQHPSAPAHHPNSSLSQFGGTDELNRHMSEYVQETGRHRLNSHENGYGNVENSDLDGEYDRTDYQAKSVDAELDPLYYNSRPNHRMNSHSTERSRSTRSTSGYSNSQDYESDVQYSFETDRMDSQCHWEECVPVNVAPEEKRILESFPSGRRRSLERQTGFEHEPLDDFIEKFHQNYGYADASEDYPQSSFDSYQDYRDNQTPENWDKDSRYLPEYGKENSYFSKQWSDETEQSKVSGSWDKENGEWFNDSFKNSFEKDVATSDWKNGPASKEWKKSPPTESNWNRSSPQREWKNKGNNEELNKVKDVSSAKNIWPNGNSRTDADKNQPKGDRSKNSAKEECFGEPFSHTQIDAIINKMQDENEQNELKHKQKNHEKIVTEGKYLEQLGEQSDSMETNEDLLVHKPVIHEQLLEHSPVITEQNENDPENYRRASTQLILKPSDLPLVNTIEVEIPNRETEVPNYLIGEEQQSWSRAKRHWIHAFNKIVVQLNEVGAFYF